MSKGIQAGDDGAALMDGRFLVDEREAARLLSVCPRTIWGLAKTGKLPFKKVGSRKLYSVEGLRRFAEGDGAGAA